MPIVRISARGRIVIPQEIREKLGLQSSHRLFLEFSVKDKTIKLRLVVTKATNMVRDFPRSTNVLELRSQERKKEIAREDRRARK